MTAARESAGITQRELGEADAWGGTVSTETISKIESGRADSVTIRILAPLLLRLGIKPEALPELDSAGYGPVAARMRRLTSRDIVTPDTYASRVFRG
jgi:transcriptional regulator with XRE-family HTH domain